MDIDYVEVVLLSGCWAVYNVTAGGRRTGKYPWIVRPTREEAVEQLRRVSGHYVILPR